MKCALCGDQIEQFSEFPNPKGKGVTDLKCYAAIMDNAPMPTGADIVNMFKSAVN